MLFLSLVAIWRNDDIAALISGFRAAKELSFKACSNNSLAAIEWACREDSPSNTGLSLSNGADSEKGDAYCVGLRPRPRSGKMATFGVAEMVGLTDCFEATVVNGARCAQKRSLWIVPFTSLCIPKDKP